MLESWLEMSGDRDTDTRRCVDITPNTKDRRARGRARIKAVSNDMETTHPDPPVSVNSLSHSFVLLSSVVVRFPFISPSSPFLLFVLPRRLFALFRSFVGQEPTMQAATSSTPEAPLLGSTSAPRTL